MRTLDSISKKDITHDEKVHIASMCWNNDYGAIRFVVALNFCYVRLVNDYFLVNIAEQLMKEPSKHTN